MAELPLAHDWNHLYRCQCCGITKLMALLLGATQCSGVAEVKIKSKVTGG
jgi:hypothetical protein